MINVSLQQLEKTSGHGSTTYTGELSELRMPGFPENFKVPGLGNGQRFSPVANEIVDGTIMMVEYRQICGMLRVKIFND